MQIAVDARFLQQDVFGPGDFTTEVFSRLAAINVQHQFIFLVDKNEDSLKMPQNVSYLKVTPFPSNAILLKWWYDVKVLLALKKCNADVFVCPNGLCSLTTKVPQVLIVQALSFKKSPAVFANFNRHFFKKYLNAFLKKAHTVGVVSAHLQNQIADTFHISPDKITVTNAGANDFFKPVSWEEKEAIKEKYSQCCEYFIFNAILHSAENLLNILKAFSVFKKWQKTNMKLLIVGGTNRIFDRECQKLSTYKYKNDVLITGLFPKQELASVTAGAYAAIFLEPEFPTPVLEAMQCEVPAIIAGKQTLEEVIDQNALLVNSTDFQNIAEQMKLIFKDEQLRSDLVEKAKLRAKDFSWNKTADILWQLIEKAISK